MLRLNRWVPRILDGLIARKIKRLYAPGIERQQVGA